MNEKNFEFVEHPADIKVVVRAGSAAEVFAGAAHALTEYLFGEEIWRRIPDEEEEIRIEAIDMEALLVDWLSELLFLSDTRRRAYISVSSIEVSPAGSVRATVGSCSARAVQDIKAVTYHDVQVLERQKLSWEAAVTFDI